MKSKVIISAIAIMAILGLIYIKNTRETGVKEITQSNKPQKTHNTNNILKGKETTAREAYKVALKEAKKWDNNVVLIKVTNFSSDETKPYGEAEHWDFWFDSDNKDKLLEVDILNGEIMRTDEPFKANSKPLVEGWLDSPEVIEKAGEKINYDDCKRVWMGASQNDWNVKCSREGQEPFWVILDAKTGKIKETRTGY